MDIWAMVAIRGEGQLGDGGFRGSPKPFEVVGLEDATSVSADSSRPVRCTTKTRWATDYHIAIPCLYARRHCPRRYGPPPQILCEHLRHFVLTI